MYRATDCRTAQIQSTIRWTETQSIFKNFWFSYTPMQSVYECGLWKFRGLQPASDMGFQQGSEYIRLLGSKKVGVSNATRLSRTYLGR